MKRIEMNEKERKREAEKFVKFWRGKGYEKGQTQAFWLSLLHGVFGEKEPEKLISFEDQVILKNTNFIDAYIPSTRVLIEQKGSHVVLNQKIKQSDGSMLTPFQQARRYISGLSFSTYPRWIVVCNFTEFHVHDMERPDAPPEVIALEDLPNEFHRLNFLVQDQKEVIRKEKELSIVAGELVGQLYDELLKGYKDPSSPESLHSLNVLCVRLVFCLYAEDAGIFGRKRMFHDYLAEYRERPRDVRRAVIDLFEVLDTPIEQRDPYLDEELLAFPYVNGKLFADARVLEVPNFSPEIVSLLLNEASEGFDWSKISPTIFGAVFESTLNPETRRKGGMHYTSVENIHRVIDPLFLNDLKDELAKIRSIKTVNTKTERLQAFHEKLASLTFLDPACGSGNFLTETYLSLRRLENEIIRIQSNGQVYFNIEGLSPIKISLAQFYGIEINDFACAVAKTALWIGESQMLNETEDILQKTIPFFPLKTLTNVVEGNALTMDWNDVVPQEKLNYIMGNPPFVGYSNQSASQKEEMLQIYVDENGKPYKTAGKIDYVSAWYFKASQLIQGLPIRCAFVSTNSITQGEQVVSVWKPLFERFGIHIDFAYRTFRWDSEASGMAHVHCVIVGFSNTQKKEKTIFFEDGTSLKAKNINGYLIDAQDVFVESRNTQLCQATPMVYGSKPADGGFLLLSEEERSDILHLEPQLDKFIKRLYGADEYINNKKRYCFWLVDAEPSEIKKSKLLRQRIDGCRLFRLASKKEATRKSAEYPMLFQENRQPTEGKYLLVPSVSSERRKYIPIGYVDHSVICSNANLLIPSASKYEFGVLTSSLHMAWMRAVAGRLEMRYRYSANIVYNNFVWANVSEKAKVKIEETAQAILDARANHPDSSFADLYDDTFMPQDLRNAHKANDKAVLEAYGLKANSSESEIVAHLMKLYVERVAEIEKLEAVDTAVSKIIGKKAETVPEWMLELREQCLEGALSVDEMVTQGKARLKEEKKKAKRLSAE